MENRIRDYVYHNDTNYTSYDSIKYLFVCVSLFLSLIAGTYALVDGLWWGFSLLITLNCVFMLHIVLIKHLKKTYRLRFLSDGIIDTLLSNLFLLSAYIVLYATKCDTPIVTYGTLFAYLIFLVSFIIFTICSSCYNKRPVLREKAPKGHLIFIGSIIPISGMIGIMIARFIFGAFDFKNEVVVYIVFAILVFVSLIFSLGYSNFVKYFYCVKYKITCDRCGNTSSPKLECRIKEKVEKKFKKKIPTKFKIIITVISVPPAIFVVLFIVSFIKVIIGRI